MNDIKVSIIIPMWNVETYIEGCIRNVQNQDFTEGLECIIVDDCGQDKSGEIAQQAIDLYQGPIVFKLIKHPFNKGCGAARNTGIRNATGQYVYFLDADDKILPHCISAMFDIAERHDYPDMVLGNFSIGHGKTSKFFLNENLPEYTNDKKWISQLFLLRKRELGSHVWNRLFSRDLFEKHQKMFFNEDLKTAEDHHLRFYVGKYVKSIGICRKITYEYNHPTYNKNPHSILQSVNAKSKREKRELYARTFKLILDDWLDNASEPFLENQIIMIKSCYNSWTLENGKGSRKIKKRIQFLGGEFSIKENFKFSRVGILIR